MKESVGEKAIKINGKEYKLRPDFNALVCIESDSGRSLIQMFDDFTNRSPRVTDVVNIIFYCAISYDPDASVSKEEIYRGIQSEKIMKVAMEAYSMLINILSGPEKKKEPEDKNQSKE